MSEEQGNNLWKILTEMAEKWQKDSKCTHLEKSKKNVLTDIQKNEKNIIKILSQMREKKMTKKEKIADKIKDSLEDIISSDVDKKEKR